MKTPMHVLIASSFRTTTGSRNSVRNVGSPRFLLLLEPHSTESQHSRHASMVSPPMPWTSRVARSAKPSLFTSHQRRAQQTLSETRWLFSESHKSTKSNKMRMPLCKPVLHKPTIMEMLNSPVRQREKRGGDRTQTSNRPHSPTRPTSLSTRA